MAQLSSAQREPSMEEILASIRRIIEDSDLPKPAAAATPTVEAGAGVAPAFDQPTFQEFEAFSRVPEEVAPTIEPTIVPPAANEDRPDAAMEFGQEPVTAVLNTVEKHIESEPVASEPPVSVEVLDWNLGVTDEAVINQLSEADFDLAEVADAVLKELSEEQAVEIRSAAFEVPSVELGATTEAFDAPPAAFDRHADAAFDAPEDVFDSHLEAVETSTVAAAPAAGEAPTLVAEAQATEDETSPVADEPTTAPLEQVVTVLTLANNNEPSRAAIISEQAGRQVTASFSELAEAFAARGRKSLDEVAEELMRPMLQDWLDNNLPIMVERLVREEIERVARGVEA